MTVIGNCIWDRSFKENVQAFMLELELINLDALILRYVCFFSPSILIMTMHAGWLLSFSIPE